MDPATSGNGEDADEVEILRHLKDGQEVHMIDQSENDELQILFESGYQTNSDSENDNEDKIGQLLTSDEEDAPEVKGPPDLPDLEGPPDLPDLEGPPDLPDLEGPPDLPDVEGPHSAPEETGFSDAELASPGPSGAGPNKARKTTSPNEKKAKGHRYNLRQNRGPTKTAWRAEEKRYCIVCEESRPNMCEVHPFIVRPGDFNEDFVFKKSRLPWAGNGAFYVGKEKIPYGTRFGPYPGVLKELHFSSSVYAWEIRDPDLREPIKILDPEDPKPHRNWMVYVNCSYGEEMQNLTAEQYRGQIFYRAERDIRQGEEFYIYYGDEYARDLGILSSSPEKTKPQRVGKKRVQGVQVLFDLLTFMYPPFNTIALPQIYKIEIQNNF